MICQHLTQQRSIEGFMGRSQLLTRVEKAKFSAPLEKFGYTCIGFNRLLCGR
jgi:hypothetical protein